MDLNLIMLSDKSQSKGEMLYNSIHITIMKWQIIETENKLVGSGVREGGWREMAMAKLVAQGDWLIELFYILTVAVVTEIYIMKLHITKYTHRVCKAN